MSVLAARLFGFVRNFHNGSPWSSCPSWTTFRYAQLLQGDISTYLATQRRHFDLYSCSRTTFRPLQLLMDNISICPAAPGRHFDLPSYSPTRFLNNSPSIIAVFEKPALALHVNPCRSIWLSQRSTGAPSLAPHWSPLALHLAPPALPL